MVDDELAKLMCVVSEWWIATMRKLDQRIFVGMLQSVRRNEREGTSRGSRTTSNL